MLRLLAAGQALDQLHDGRHAGGTADEHHVVDLGDLDVRVLDDLQERVLAAVEQVRGHPLELGPGEPGVQVQRAVRGVRDVRQVDLRLHRLGKLDLGLLRRLPQPLQRHLVLRQVHAEAALEVLHQPVDDALVPVVATKVVVAAGRLDLDHAVADVQEGHVEGAATKVEDQDLGGPLLLQVVGESRRSRLVDDAEHIEAGDRASLLGRLPLRVTEVRRDGDHRVGDLLAEVGLGVPLQLLQDEGADLLGGELLAVDRDGPVGPHVALDRADRPVNIGDSLPLRDLADENLGVLGERHHGRGRPRSLSVGDDRRLPAFEDGDNGVGRPEVNTYRTCHEQSL